MPRYYFNVRQGDSVVPDAVGSELTDLATAEIEARLTARDLILGYLRAGCPVDGREIDIVDATGAILETIKVRSVVDVP
jgi:hypothetical protein